MNKITFCLEPKKDQNILVLNKKRALSNRVCVETEFAKKAFCAQVAQGETKISVFSNLIKNNKQKQIEVTLKL